jgi:glyoxylase-like metal-dependent hydrolase (beta-lactamase superfamily II)/rhodanese-related sulfurtransferase
MYIEQLYTNCLAEAAYYIESEGLAAVIDPIREPEPYLQLAASRGAKILYVFETHFHADFVSGHIDLAAQTGAKIIYGPGAKPAYPVYNAQDGEEFPLGKLSIKTLHTPGHTLESTCWLLLDENKKEHALFTGDTLFIGDVGRPDLASGNMSSEDLASILYDSLRTKVMTLPDEVLVYPGHGAGSSCGKNLGPEKYSTLGQQKQNNYALRDISKAQFILEVTDGMQPPPAYFFKDASINIKGYPSIESVRHLAGTKLSAEEVRHHLGAGITVLDSRIPDQFEKGFIPGSVNIGLNGQFAIWAASLIDMDAPLILITEPGKESESADRLARVGFHHILGYLEGGPEAWTKAGYSLETITSISPETLFEKYQEGHIHILDVRKAPEVEAGHIRNAQFQTLDTLENNLHKLHPDHTYFIHCQGGYRSMMAASLMRKHGFRNLINIYQGFGGISKTAIPIVTGLPPQHAEMKAGVVL